ncbi:MAG: hypothetical protein U0O39_05860, partial [Akkermansia sp.]
PGDRHSISSWNDKNSTYVITLINTTIQGILMKKTRWLMQTSVRNSPAFRQDQGQAQESPLPI